MMALVTFKFDISDRVHIDDEKSIVGVVTGLLRENTGGSVRVSWFNAGEMREHWLPEWRVTPAGG